MSEGKSLFVVPELWSEGFLASITIGGEELTASKRVELRGRVKAGEVGVIEFKARVFKEGTNANHFRFYTEDLPSFCDSFQGQPFLADHNTRQIAARHGVVHSSVLLDDWFTQTIRLTDEAGMLALVDGKIDRFSIGWRYDGINCSICKSDWFRCSHWPGRAYRVGRERQEILCELYFVNPRGKETSAVNSPAVDGTGLLAQLSGYKESLLKMEPNELRERSVVEESLTVVPANAQPAYVEWLDLALLSQPEAVAQFVRTQAQRLSAAGVAVSASVIGELVGDARSLAGAAPVAAPVAAAPVAAPVTVAAPLAAQAVRGHYVAGHPPVLASLTTGLDVLQNAWEWHLGYEEATVPPRYALDIRQLYMDTTGDYGWHGVFDPENAQLAAADSTTLPGMVANAMNKILVGVWNNYEAYRWFEDIVMVQPNDGSLQDMQWIQFGGIADLPTVVEGAAYTEATVTDSQETSAFSKRGVYVGITLEAIRRSQVARIKAVPQALALACVRTRSAQVANIFTQSSGVGPTLSQDSTALFHSNHGNLATTAFSHSAWKAARIECAKQAELGSGRRQALWPKYCLVPFDLYDDALQVFGYGSGSEGQKFDGASGRAVNPYGRGRKGDPRPLVVAVPDFTDANDWAYIADCKLAPIIQMSYAQSRSGRVHPKPEIFSVASRTSGLVFSNDTLPVKIRDWFAVGVATYRGIGKRNVA